MARTPSRREKFVRDLFVRDRFVRDASTGGRLAAS